MRSATLVWTATGKVVGSRMEFEQECDAKYRLRIEPSKNDGTWKQIAKENAREWGGQAPAADDVVGDGESVREALLLGHERFLARGSKAAAGVALSPRSVSRDSSPRGAPGPPEGFTNYNCMANFV